MALLSIGEVARKAGVAPSTLRYYERAGVIPKPARVSGRRRYGEELVSLIELARFAQGVGFTLEEIRVLFARRAPHDLGEAWRALAQAKVRQLEEGIERAQRMKQAIEAGLACGCIRFSDECARRAAPA